LCAAWTALARSEALDDGDRVGEALLDAYAEPHRYYHGLAHVAYLLTEIERRRPLLADPGLLALTAWFHDAIYDPLAKDNEARSAAWAEQALPPARAAGVALLVRKTAAHHAGDATSDEALFLDMDFSIRGAPREVYARYAQTVRAEYAAIPEDRFRVGRAAFLKGVLAQPRMFRTELYEHEMGDVARANIAWEIDALAR
jgi:predicted metal-dependent HD superfamily phosphohydrolase